MKLHFKLLMTSPGKPRGQTIGHRAPDRRAMAITYGVTLQPQH
jgi:hypothetical protein